MNVDPPQFPRTQVHMSGWKTSAWNKYATYGYVVSDSAPITVPVERVRDMAEEKLHRENIHLVGERYACNEHYVRMGSILSQGSIGLSWWPGRDGDGDASAIEVGESLCTAEKKVATYMRNRSRGIWK